MVKLGDKQSFKRGLANRVEDVRDDQLEAMIDVAIREGNKVLRQEAPPEENFGSPPPEQASMDEWNMEPIADSVEKRKEGDTWVAEWTHPHANKIEVGVRPHEITGDPLLVFEAQDGTVVFTHKVEHPGIPALGYVRRGFRQAIRDAQSGAYED